MTALGNHPTDREAGSKQKLRAWLKLLKTTKVVEADLRERLRTEFGTTLPRFDVLAALYRADKGLTMSALSTALMVSNGNVTGIVERLVSDGLVVRVPVAGDKRAMLVRLTRRGQDDFAVMARVHEQWVDTLFRDLTEQDAAELLSLLSRIGADGGARDPEVVR